MLFSPLSDSRFEFLQVRENFRVKIEFSRCCESVFENVFQFPHFDMVVLDEEEDVFQIFVQSTIQLAKRDTIWVGNVNFKISELTNANSAFLVSFWQGHETFKRDCFNVNLHFFCDSH